MQLPLTQLICNPVCTQYQPSMILTTAVSCICISRIFLDLRHEFNVDRMGACEDVYTMSWRVERVTEEGRVSFFGSCCVVSSLHISIMDFRAVICFQCSRALTP